MFEADPAIKFTYAWNRMNVYRSVVMASGVWEMMVMRITVMMVMLIRGMVRMVEMVITDILLS